MNIFINTNYCKVRSNAARDVVIDTEPKEEKGDLGEVEKNYV